MDLSIIIVNFNTPQVTLHCIQSIHQHCAGIEYEIVLVDNFPKADYQPIFTSAFPTIRYILSKENIGFGRANNLGMRTAKGKHFLLLNSDTVVFDDSIQQCLNYLQEASAASTGLLGCRLLNADGSYQPSFYPFTKNDFFNHCIANNPLLYKLFNRRDTFIETKTIKKVGDISGAFMLLKAEVYQTTGGFDPDFFLYYEESDWCRNRILKTYDIIYYPHAAITHLGGQSAPKDFMQIQAKISQGLFWYKKGTMPYLGFLLFELCNLPFFILQWLLAPQRNNKTAIFKSINAVLKAMPYWLFNIPRYKQKFGSRSVALIYEKARSIFFNP